MYCPKCGTQNDDNNFRCIPCGEVLHPESPMAIQEIDSTLGGLIPTRNPSALASYYLGIFSVLPFIGIPLGAAALLTGIKGLRIAEDNPEARGKIHAWVGILVGGFFGLGYLVLTIFLIGLAVMSS